jgi:hypothetical protein
LLGGCAKFFKCKHNNEFREGDKLVMLEFSRATIILLSWKLCKRGEGLLSWVYANVDEISFNSKIEGNCILAMEIEEEQGMNSIGI